MTRDEVIALANKAGVYSGANEVFIAPSLERFANLVAAKEREACAQICDAIQKKNEDAGAFVWEAKDSAKAIRARSES